MSRVLIYGSFDFFHIGHKKLLERSKKYGHKIYVGVSSKEFNLEKGKRNIQSLKERMQRVSQYKGVVKVFVQNSFEQKKEDIKKYKIDFLVAGDDWIGNNDHLREFCRVIYLPRTKGVSSSEIRKAIEKKRRQFNGTKRRATS
ncbi:MAG: adenylyltransferase/cytidyltransferase family protein [Fusobacteriaceae bacterium]